tara:strand:+ start:1310 stop:1954 length:645 start_codon:yes stop_codon:yes gene_type:complete
MKILNNIATKERLYVVGAIAAAVTCIIVCLGAMLLYKNATDKATAEKRNEIYVAVNGSIIKAQLEEDFSQPLEMAHKGFLELFHNYVWSVEPNTQYIEKNKSKAMAMGDKTVDMLFRLLESKGYYSNLISGDYSVIFDVKEADIVIDYTHDLPQFTLTGTLKTLRTNDVVVKKVVTVGKIVQRSYGFSNFTGFQVLDMEVLEFKELRIIKYKEL